MANESNLKPLNERTQRERKEIAKKGAAVANAKKKEKKLLKELLEEALETETKTGTLAVDITNALVKKAKKGNVKAYEVIRDTLGQKPKEKISVENPQATKVLDSISKQLKKHNNE